MFCLFSSSWLIEIELNKIMSVQRLFQKQIGIWKKPGLRFIFISPMKSSPAYEILRIIIILLNSSKIQRDPAYFTKE